MHIHGQFVSVIGVVCGIYVCVCVCNSVQPSMAAGDGSRTFVVYFSDSIISVRKMAANVRDSDTSLWLHNKLGTSSEWTSGSICSQLNKEVLRNIKDCFSDLQTQVKLKLLLSFFHIPRRLVEEVLKKKIVIIVHVEKKKLKIKFTRYARICVCVRVSVCAFSFHRILRFISFLV